MHRWTTVVSTVVLLATAACSDEDVASPATITLPAGGAGGSGDGGASAGGSGAGGQGAGGASAARGFIGIDPDHPQYFVYENGERYFPFGDTSYALLGETEQTIRTYIDSRSAHRFNFIRLCAVAPGFWPFGGTPGEPDFLTIDEAALAKLDATFDYAAGRGINIELLLWGYGAEGGNGMWLLDPAEGEDLWIETLVERYADRENLLMWTVTNEFERYPDGSYDAQWDEDVGWARSVAARIREVDTRHPIGVHADAGWGTDGSGTLVVWPLWEDSAVDVYNVFNRSGHMQGWWGDCPSEGTHPGVNYASVTWNGDFYPAEWMGDSWNNEAPGIEEGLAEDWSHLRPVINTEFGYQVEADLAPDHPNVLSCQLYHPDKIRKTAWKSATSGAGLAAGFVHTVKDVDPDKIDVWRPEQLEILFRFFTEEIDYWTMAPHHELVELGTSVNTLLARVGEEYVAYFPRGGTNEIDLLARSYTVRWLNPRTGESVDGGLLAALGGATAFTPPADLDADWVLHLEATP